jgi:hypothetical protein
MTAPRSPTSVREALDEYLVGDPVETEAALAETFGS